MRVIEADRAHLQRAWSESKPCLAVEQRLHVYDEDLPPGFKVCRQPIVSDRYAGHAKLCRLLERLPDQELVRANVDHRACVLVQVGLEHQQADQGLPLAGVELQDQITILPMGSEPRFEDRALRWP